MAGRVTSGWRYGLCWILGVMTILGLVDRGAVLFVGIAVGAVLTLAFETGGKPLAGMVAQQRVAAPAPAPARGKGAACGDDFPLSRRVLTGLRANRPLRVGVMGDSFGDGIFAAAQGELEKREGFKVYQFSKEGTGFTRYQSLDVLKDVKGKLAQQPIDIAIIDFGANDTQGVRQDGHGAAYMTPHWQAIVGGRARALVGYLREQGVAVAWVGLPRMRKADYDQDIQAMNGFYAGLMCQLHVPFVNPVAASEDKEHHFAKELVDPVTKAPYVARADDGVHMSYHGYREIIRPVLTRIAALGKPDGADDDAGREK